MSATYFFSIKLIWRETRDSHELFLHLDSLRVFLMFTNVFGCEKAGSFSFVELAAEKWSLVSRTLSLGIAWHERLRAWKSGYSSSVVDLIDWFLFAPYFQQLTAM